MARLSIRIDLDGEGGRLGPGKVMLLEAIAEHGSITAAGRALSISYKRAWDLVAEMNACFPTPVVTAKLGGRRGGGAQLTPLGASLIAHYRDIEQAAMKAARPHLEAVEAARRRESTRKD